MANIDRIKNCHMTIGILYHGWGVELLKNPAYKISDDDLKTMEWAKKEFHKAVKETA